MSPNFKRVADYILANPEDVALSSMREIAGRLELDPSNFVRFAKFLSFDGYPELRDIFQQDLKSSRTEYTLRAQKIQNQEGLVGIPDLLQELNTASSANLMLVYEQNSSGILLEASENLLKAKRVFILGLRSCFPAAFSLHYQCKLIREDVILSDGHGGTFADDIRGIGRQDVFVAIGMHPYTRDTIIASEYAASNGATIIALTDSVLSPLAKNADALLTFSHKGPNIPGTIVPVMALVEALTAVMIASGGQKALDAIRKSEEQLHEFSAYLSPKTRRNMADVT